MMLQLNDVAACEIEKSFMALSHGQSPSRTSENMITKLTDRAHGGCDLSTGDAYSS
jgi:hypothetical protein